MDFKEIFRTILLSIGSIVGVESVDKILFIEHLNTLDLIVKILVQLIIGIVTVVYLTMKIRYYKSKK